MNKIVHMQFGSIIYGTNLPSSDLDYKAVYVPCSKDLILQRAKGTIVQTTKVDKTAKNEAGDIDLEVYSLQQFFKLLLEGQTVTMDMLFTPKKHWVESSPVWEQIINNRSQWLHSGYSSFAGYCKTQASKYGIKGSRVAAMRAAMEFMDSGDFAVRLNDSPLICLINAHPEYIKLVTCRGPNGTDAVHLEVCNRKIPLSANKKYAYGVFKRIFDEYGARSLLAEKNQGIDWKALMHAVRIAQQSEELLLTGNIEFPRPNADLLLKIRQGLLPYRQVADIIEEGLSNMENASFHSMLPKEPNRIFAEELIYNTYQDSLIREWNII